MDRLDLEATEDAPHFRRVVEGEQEAPVDACELLGQALEVRAIEDAGTIVSLAAIIGRIEIEEGIGAVVAGDQLVGLAGAR